MSICWILMEESGQPQRSLTDADARLMKSKNGFAAACKNVISDIEIKKVRRKVSDEQETDEPVKSIYGTQEEMMARAGDGYFIRDPERNLAYCPHGEILRQKCIRKNGNIRYANKNACRHCPNRNKCYKGKNEWKEIDFTKDCLEKPYRDWLKAEGKEPDNIGAARGKGRFKKVKVVRFFLKPDRTKTAERMCLSEHLFGTIKRAKNLSGFDKMMELMAV